MAFRFRRNYLNRVHDIYFVNLGNSINNVASNEIQNYFNVPNSPFSSSYYIGKLILMSKSTAMLSPLLLLL